MEDREIAAKRHKKRKTDCFYAPFRGYSLFPLCSLCWGIISTPNADAAWRQCQTSPLVASPGTSSSCTLEIVPMVW